MAFVATQQHCGCLCQFICIGSEMLGNTFYMQKKYQTENSNLKVLKEKRITAYVASQCLWPIFFYHLKRANLVLYHNVQLNLRGV